MGRNPPGSSTNARASPRTGVEVPLRILPPTVAAGEKKRRNCSIGTGIPAGVGAPPVQAIMMSPPGSAPPSCRSTCTTAALAAQFKGGNDKVTVRAVVCNWPSEETVTESVSEAGALLATFTVRVIGGKLAPGGRVSLRLHDDGEQLQPTPVRPVAVKNAVTAEDDVGGRMLLQQS